MTSCDTTRGKLFAYLDGELGPGELAEFESHLHDCLSCQAALVGRRRFLGALLCARPEFSPPEELRSRINSILIDPIEPVSLAVDPRPGFWGRATSALGGFRWLSPRLAFGMALLLAVAGGIWLDQAGRQPRSEFAVAALGAHQRRLHAGLPLGIRSSSPTEVSTWFQGKVPVHVNLPRNEDLPQQELPYQIEGAGLVAYHDGNLGLVAYRVGNEPVTLVIAPASTVTLAGQKQVPMKSLVIHYDFAEGYHIVTWAVPKKGVTYALVSNRRQHANQSCIVCHAGPKDRAFMQNLLSQ